MDCLGQWKQPSEDVYQLGDRDPHVVVTAKHVLGPLQGRYGPKSSGTEYPHDYLSLWIPRLQHVVFVSAAVFTDLQIFESVHVCNRREVGDPFHAALVRVLCGTVSVLPITNGSHGVCSERFVNRHLIHAIIFIERHKHVDGRAVLI